MGLLQWLVPGVVAVSCLSTAVSAWKPDGWLAAPSRRSLLAAVLEVAFVAVMLRLVFPGSPGAVALWTVSVAALAAAVAGLIIRWPVLPVRPKDAQSRDARAGEAHAQDAQVVAEHPEERHPGTGQAGEPLPGEPQDQAAQFQAPARAVTTKKRRRSSGQNPGAKKQREPGRVSIAVRGILLLAALGLSMAVGF
ncbi:hypothetical protein H9639_16235 [Arthrobacter sp. Sa2CUA1]|uniref:Uncharacterized protein n=1 Tax=Arthrobacter gallicola TaxID=2762225 RepID=A0ABR8UX58_9MICC|nr:hypothetical protein [Arthrobacter gallicola]MBD7996846.1 hypothetical protein [Arthrobacter gallicola]